MNGALELLAGLTALFAPLLLAWWLVARSMRHKQRGKMPRPAHRSSNAPGAHEVRSPAPTQEE